MSKSTVNADNTGQPNTDSTPTLPTVPLGTITSAPILAPSSGSISTGAKVGIALGGAFLLAAILGYIMHTRGKATRIANAKTAARNRSNLQMGIPERRLNF